MTRDKNVHQGYEVVLRRRETILRRPYEHLSKKKSSDSVPLRIKSHGGGGAKLTSWRDTAIEVSREAGLHNLPREELCPPGSVIRTIPNGRITINHSIPGLSKALPTELQLLQAKNFLDSLGPATTNVWTDGSAQESVRNGGSGVFISFPDGTTSKLSAPAGSLSSSLSAEMNAIHLACSALLENGKGLGSSIRFHTDSKSSP